MDRRTLGKLPRGVASIKVSGATEVEVKEKKDRVDDAMWRHRGRWQRGADLHYRCTGQTAGEYADQKVRLEGRLCFRPSRCKALKKRTCCTRPWAPWIRQTKQIFGIAFRVPAPQCVVVDRQQLTPFAALPSGVLSSLLKATS